MAYVINKHIFRKRVKSSIRLNHPDKWLNLSNSKIDSGLVFADGMVAAISVLGEEPINTKELDDLVLRETIQFLLNNE